MNNNWIVLKSRPTQYGANKNLPGVHREHLQAIREYNALPWYVRAVKHVRAAIGNERLK